MKFEYDSYEEYLMHHQSAHDSIIFWKKQLQCVQGKINMNVDGSPTHYDEEECKDKMKECAYVLKAVEDSVHPDYIYEEDENGFTISTTRVLIDGVVSYSAILLKMLGSLTCAGGGKVIETYETEYE